jgi:hypothetical protein
MTEQRTSGADPDSIRKVLVVRSPSGHCMAGVHRANGELVAAGDVQDR